MSSDFSVHPASLSPQQLLADCSVKRTRGSGPGGQHRNKVETAVVITHRPSGVRAEASERRSQADNHRIAVTRVRVKLALEIRSCQTLPDDFAPSDLWRSRCRDRRVRVSHDHPDFAALLAEVLDVCEALQGDVATAAARLGTTSSQLVKFLQLEPAALQQINSIRLATRNTHFKVNPRSSTVVRTRRFELYLLPGSRIEIDPQGKRIQKNDSGFDRHAPN